MRPIRKKDNSVNWFIMFDKRLETKATLIMRMAVLYTIRKVLLNKARFLLKRQHVFSHETKINIVISQL